MTIQNENSAQLLTKAEAIKYLNISQSSLYRLENQDKTFPKPIRLVGAIRYQQKAIDKWLDAQAGDNNIKGGA